VLLVPAHIDPTINLHDTLFVWDAATASLDRWPVDGRRVEWSELPTHPTFARKGRTP
jgi:hypothetical protein